ncbi:hypothetical protein K3X41_05005 [Aliiroseovarius crassostreae]|uniref:hypothetical protein n=1 Tax=Aliiroseovarius crassostreae TaxID=154981 RepID=UPI00220B1CAB|nr:hypothetical protein [Aliiroseovarius crassostreae]UWQ08958.1 hypothetical protein K3X25_05135 [Aliiroseovarius crassostreae]UWQ12040.1 hypothetical protein K3X41_05005 [Aliiroseovarius crassostreae]
MSNPENFIDEVTEEVRRDKLFALMRKYGWIGVTGVLLLVGGAAYNEWSKAQAQAKAEAVGDAILAAEELEDRAARAKMLQGVAVEGDAKAVLSLLAADAEEGRTSLERLAQDASLPKVYRDLAALKLVMQAGTDMEPQQAAEHLEPLLVAGAPFRVMAEEQMALVELAQGQKDAAISRLQTLLSDEEASRALRQRASQLIVALGGVPEAS